jgi:hypothetical protein
VHLYGNGLAAVWALHSFGDDRIVGDLGVQLGNEVQSQCNSEEVDNRGYEEAMIVVSAFLLGKEEDGSRA